MAAAVVSGFSVTAPSESLRVSGGERDPRVQALIDESFKIFTLPLHELMFQGRAINYIYWGSLDYAFQDKKNSARGIKASELAKEFASQERFDVLDLGTANGLFLKGMKDQFKNVNVVGITAADCRPHIKGSVDQSEVSDEEYLVANIENLNQIPALKDRKFDMIVSLTTFRHFCDPIGVICQAYDMLKDKGVLILDNFELRGIDGRDYYKIFEKSGCSDITIHPRKLRCEIEGRSVQVASDFSVAEQTQIRKTTEHLNLPVFYDLEKSTAAAEISAEGCGGRRAQIFYKLEE